MATDPLKYMIPIGTNGHQATDPWKHMIPIGTNGHQAAEGRSPNARVDSVTSWREAASSIEQLKLLLLNPCEKQIWKL